MKDSSPVMHEENRVTHRPISTVGKIEGHRIEVKRRRCVYREPLAPLLLIL